MASLKSEIKKAITNNSKYTAGRVWKVEVTENLAEEMTMWIEVSVKKKRGKKRR